MRIVGEQARRHGAFILSECGAHGFGDHHAWGHPAYFHELLADSPDVDVLLAHLGRGAADEVMALTRAHDNVFTDLSLRVTGVDEAGELSAREMAETIRAIGTDRVLYGTNYPLVDVRASREKFLALPMSDAELAAVGWENVERLLARTAERRAAAQA
jgi:predicted TIM-barrel fold metal-dependent hydrolase